MTRSIIAPTALAAGLHAGTVTLVLQVVKPQPPVFAGSWYQRKPGDLWHDPKHPDLWHFVSPSGKENHVEPIRCPFFVGQTLYVRETWNDSHGSVLYRADGEPLPCGSATCHWRPAATMPRRYVRAFLTVTSIACSRALDLTDDQICRVLGAPLQWPGPGPEPYTRNLKWCMEHFWTRLHGPEAMVEWVWAVGVVKV